jgi:hypothetical protein
MVAVAHEELTGGVQDGPSDRLPLTFLTFFYTQVFDSLKLSAEITAALNSVH